jgi:ABC-type antimicrobial peptide transport system permease subunit
LFSVRPRELHPAIAVFAVTTLGLAALGVYGVVRYRLSQRVKEIAIRVTFGAPGWRVTAVGLADTIASAGLGLAGGLVLALGAASAIRGYLFNVEPSASASRSPIVHRTRRQRAR